MQSRHRIMFSDSRREKIIAAQYLKIKGFFKMDAKQFEIPYQMGINLQKYQEIEQIFKRIISISSQTVYVKLPIQSFNKDSRPELNIWSNQTNIANATLGNLLTQLEKTENEPKYQDSHVANPELIQVFFSYHVPIIKFVDKEKFALDFKQVVQDRNRFIHHFPNKDNQDAILGQLKEEYERADKFKENHLIPFLNTIINHIEYNTQPEIIKQIKIVVLNFGRLSAYELFEQIYEKHKRPDNWAVWASIIQEIQKEYPYVLSNLRQESSFVGKNVALNKIIKEAYPNWQFMKENTPKGKQLLVKIDNSLVNLREEDNQPTENLSDSPKNGLIN